MDRELGKMSKGPNTLFIKETEWKKELRVDFREWYLPYGGQGQLKPSKAGLSLSFKDFGRFAEIIAGVASKLKAEGKI